VGGPEIVGVVGGCSEMNILSLYKKYDLIPQNVSMEFLRNNFNDFVSRTNSTSRATIEKYTQYLLSIKPIKDASQFGMIMNRDCSVNAVVLLTLRFGIGLSPIIGRIHCNKGPEL
jgi:hypothetical protein